eukprot:1150302-Pelagomonas_calceolata.AAC.5
MYPPALATLTSTCCTLTIVMETHVFAGEWVPGVQRMLDFDYVCGKCDASDARCIKKEVSGRASMISWSSTVVSISKPELAAACCAGRSN